MNVRFWLISSRVVMACLVATICQCGGSRPSAPVNHESLWPDDAVGEYSRTVERRACSPFECHWDTLWIDTVSVCSSPLIALTSDQLRYLNPRAEVVFEELSDSSYHAEVRVSITFPGSPTPKDCDVSFDVYSTDRNNVPAPQGWQLLVHFESVTCGEQYLPETRRYTYVRVSNTDCGTPSSDPG